MKINTSLAVLLSLLLMSLTNVAVAHGGYGMGMMMDDDDYSERMMHGRGMGMMHGQGMMGGMGMMDGMGMMQGMGPMMMPGMSDKQRNAMRDIMRDMQDKNWDRMGEMMELRNQLQDVMQADKPDPNAAGRIYEKMSKLRQQMFQDRLQARNRMMDQLTAEQREQLRNYRRQYGGQGMMMGPGMMQ